MSQVGSDPLALRLQSAFASNRLYFTMMAKHHRRHGGIAIEPEVQPIISRHCVPGARVLEAGCGEGSIANWFAARFPQTAFMGMDISPLGISMARASGLGNASFVVGDITCLPAEAESFDFIYSQSVIEHVPGWPAFLGEARRVLRPGGRLLIRVANGSVHNSSRRQAFFRYLFHSNRVLRCHPSLRLQPGNDLDHSRNFDAQEIPSDVLLREIRRAGFTLIAFTTLTQRWRNTANSLRRIAARFPIWPLSHLGPVTIVLAQKK